MTDHKFVELIFEPDSKTFPVYKLKKAYQSLAKNPQQLFALFVDVDLSTKFFSEFGLYGKTLAMLFDILPRYFSPKSEHRLTFGRDSASLRVSDENLAAFLFSLLANKFPDDAASQQAVASVTMAIITISKPGGTLSLIGEKLGEIPLILNRLISRGHIAKLSQRQSLQFNSLVSNSVTLESWTRAVASNSAGQCPRHIKKSQNIQDWEKMQQFLQSFPCEICPAIMDVTELPVPRNRKDTPDLMDTVVRAFSSLLGHHLGPWKVVISEQALGVLKEAARSDNSDHIQESLLDLASGEWMQASLRRPAGDDSRFQVPVYKAECEEYVILWQVDVAFDERDDHNTQVVKVWSICAPAELEDMCGWVIRAHQTYTNARVAACQTVNLEAAGGAVYPMAAMPPGLPEDSCKEGLAAIFGANMDTQPTAEDDAITKRSPILGKFYSLTSTVLDNIHPEASAAEFPVDPSKEQILAINHFDSPVFILGRGGSGKTTCLVYKVASKYLRSKETNGVPVRQLFLTRSKDLAQKLKLHTKRLINTSLGIIAKDQGSNGGNASEGESEEDTAQDLFSVSEEDFPLFCTFESFLKRLENSIRVHNRRNARTPKKVSRPVNLTTFKLDYWQRFPTALTRRIPMDLALIDIVGVIKGSTLKPLSRDAYITRNWRLAPNFTTENDRNTVYTLYEHYEKIKTGRGETDESDRVIKVLEALEEDPELHKVVETFIDEVYIDEVQYQRPLEINLLFYMTRNNYDIHFAGDTGQSVSKDSLFRYSNSKALFNTHFKDVSSLTEKESESWKLFSPKLLPLPNNYRSHTGIQAIASILMDLLYTAFPEQVDKLPFEIGDQIGPIPTLYVGSGLVSALHETKISTKKSVGRTSRKTPAKKDQEKTTSGKLRVILVRDEQTQSALQMKVPTSTLVLTIPQSNGMEFEDVFLYNFFTTSPYSSDFNILGDLLHEHHSPETGKHARYANWEMVDSILCSELKHLYMGITRAQTRLWIVESKEHTVLPAIDLFNKIVPALFPARYPNPLLNVVRECEFKNISELRRLLHSTDQTTPTEWSELAYKLIAKKAYIQAGLCFKNAQDKAGEALAKGYLAEMKGMEYRARSSKKESTIAFGEACELFLKAGRISKALECRETIGNTVATAELFSKNGRHQESAWLFTKAGKHKEAAHEYADLGKHEKVLETYCHAGLYDDLASHLRDFASEIDPKYGKQYSRLCYLLLIQGKCAPNLKAIITTSLGSREDQEGVFREFRMLNHVLDLHKTNKRFKDAYEVAISIGYPREAVRLARSHGLSVSQPELIIAFNYVQAEDFLSSITYACNTQKSKVARKRTRKSNNEVFLPLERKWKALIASFDDHRQGGKPNRNDLQAGGLGGFFDLVVTMKTPDMGDISPDLVSLPLDFITGAINILGTIVFTKIIPPSALLFLGIYEIPAQPGEHVILQWPPYTRKPPGPSSPTQYTNTKTVCELGGLLIRNLISIALGFVEAKAHKLLDIQTKKGLFQHKGDDGKLTSAQFSVNLQGIFSLNVLLSNFVSVLFVAPMQIEPVLVHRNFWLQALIRLMTFTSSYEQDASVLIKLKHDMTTTNPDFMRLYDRLGHHVLSQLQSETRPWPQKPFSLLSYLLQQVHTAGFLGIEVTAMKLIAEIVPKQQELRSVIELLTLAKDVRTKTTMDDFPGHFCENVISLLLKLRQVRNSRPQLLFYSPSVVSLYEELVTLLIFLIRHIDFMIPRSWTVLHLPKFVQIPRCTSKCEIFWYQRMLAKVVISFCELVERTEDVAPKNQAKTDPLARRSLYLLVVSIINMGIISPHPAVYDQMWKQVQKVFCYKGLNAGGFINLPPQQLIQNLVKAFGSYDGKDKLGVVVTDGYELPTKFAGLSLGKLGMTAIHIGLATPHKNRPRTLNTTTSSRIQMMNSVYLITRLWQTDGPQFVQRMKSRRERLEKAAHFITAFWRINGPQFIRRMQYKRKRTAFERLAQMQKPKSRQNRCILAEMRYGKDYIY